MFYINKRSDTVIIVLHEIYGVNAHMKSFCQLLSVHNFDVICPNLLNGKKSFDYSEEEVAYPNFIENIGFTYAFHKIKSLLLEIKNDYQKIFIVGFSVGATLAWLCSEEEIVDGVIGYYGSRIRDYVDVSPKCPAMLFFPQEEKSFEVETLLSTLVRKNIDVYQYVGKHGFADPYSVHYNEASAEGAFAELMKFIAEQTGFILNFRD